LDLRFAIAHSIVERDYFLLAFGQLWVGPNLKRDVLLPFCIGCIRDFAGFDSARLDDARKQEVLEDLIGLAERPCVPSKAIEPDGVRRDPPPAWLGPREGLVLYLDSLGAADRSDGNPPIFSGVRP
jgi:hypothetical protein